MQIAQEIMPLLAIQILLFSLMPKLSKDQVSLGFRIMLRAI
jgi:hypothetical protein